MSRKPPQARRVPKAAAEIITDPDSSIEDRLFAHCPDDGFRQRLGPALRTVAAQLEGLTGDAMAPGDDRHLLRFGTVTMVGTGCVLVVLAEGARCITTHWRPDGGVVAMFDEMLEMAPAIGLPPDITGPAIIHTLVELCGAPPGKASDRPPPAPHVQLGLTGGLLAMLQPAERAKIATMVEGVRSAGVCPAIVGVVGPASSGDPDACSFLWPLVVPLAGYLEEMAA